MQGYLSKARKYFRLWCFYAHQKNYRDIKYVFRNGGHKCDTLIVIFSGFSEMGKPPRYNYGETLRNVSMHQLYILDDTGYNRAGSYYLGENGDWFVPNLVCELIEKVRRNCGAKRLITAGSSKGGTAALMYGLKIGADKIIIGAPQYRIATYLSSDQHKPILESILGNAIEQGIARLNCVVEDEITMHADDAGKPVIYLHYSPEEHTYHEHIKELIDALERYHYPVVEDNQYTYAEHAEVGIYFKSFLLNVCAKDEARS